MLEFRRTLYKTKHKSNGFWIAFVLIGPIRATLGSAKAGSALRRNFSGRRQEGGDNSSDGSWQPKRAHYKRGENLSIRCREYQNPAILHFRCDWFSSRNPRFSLTLIREVCKRSWREKSSVPQHLYLRFNSNRQQVRCPQRQTRETDRKGISIIPESNIQSVPSAKVSSHLDTILNE